MATGLRCWPLAFCITLLHIRSTYPKIVEGTLSTKENWAFLTRFCYKDSIGELKYHFEYPEVYATQNIFLYFDTQWPLVYPKPDMKCIDKEDKVYRGNNQVVNLTTNYIWSGCTKKEKLSMTHLDCNGKSMFQSLKGARSQYFSVTIKVILYCDKVKIQLTVTYPNVIQQKCIDKEDKVYRGNNQVVNLTTNYIWSGCTKKEKLSMTHLDCNGDRRFVSNRERWWYLAISNCDSSKGLFLNYRLEMTNGETFWRKHFSADERFILPMDIAFFIAFIVMWMLGIYVASKKYNKLFLHYFYFSVILPMDIAFFIAFIVMWMLGIYVANLLVGRRLFHFSYKLYLTSMTFEVISLLFYIIYYVKFGRSGFETYGLSVVGRACHFISHVVFLIMLILMAKGWTVTRGRISSGGQIKLSIFGTVYTVCFAILFFYEVAVFDPGEVLYIYESPAGIGISILRVIAWLWFCYGTFFTLKHYPNKCNFYYPFWFFYTGWFLAGPIVVVIATYKIPKWEREQIVNGIDWSISILAHLVFLIITRPSAANINFPFHLRTNQIGIQEATPSRPSENGSAYYTPPPPNAPPPYYSQEAGHFTDITSMFLASGVANGNKPPYSSSNGMQNRAINGYPRMLASQSPMTGRQNGEVNGFPMMSASQSVS
ncbi:transmembrane protein 145-like [Orbicella faveolata]|uniref:transmembrane protein 145-like n=1 Tax=Orbicella faveolata TaxID=48498 RepID=UPI0009E5866B|nr:transmembrane protein 145-like [Orbicella faveolata]